MPSPLSKAPSPSGIPANRYGVTPSGFVFTVSPAANNDCTAYPGDSGSMNGSTVVLGPTKFAPGLPAALVTDKLTPVAPAIATPFLNH